MKQDPQASLASTLAFVGVETAADKREREGANGFQVNLQTSLIVSLVESAAREGLEKDARG